MNGIEAKPFLDPSSSLGENGQALTQEMGMNLAMFAMLGGSLKLYQGLQVRSLTAEAVGQFEAKVGARALRDLTAEQYQRGVLKELEVLSRQGISGVGIKAGGFGVELASLGVYEGIVGTIQENYENLSRGQGLSFQAAKVALLDPASWGHRVALLIPLKAGHAMGANIHKPVGWAAKQWQQAAYQRAERHLQSKMVEAREAWEQLAKSDQASPSEGMAVLAKCYRVLQAQQRLLEAYPELKLSNPELYEQIQGELKSLESLRSQHETTRQYFGEGNAYGIRFNESLGLYEYSPSREAALKRALGKSAERGDVLKIRVPDYGEVLVFPRGKVQAPKSAIQAEPAPMVPQQAPAVSPQVAGARALFDAGQRFFAEAWNQAGQRLAEVLGQGAPPWALAAEGVGPTGGFALPDKLLSEAHGPQDRGPSGGPISGRHPVELLHTITPGELAALNALPARGPARQILQSRSLRPVVKVRVEGRDFYLSPLIRTIDSQGRPSKDYVVAVTRDIVDGQPLLVRRLYYHSASGGGWRVTPVSVGGILAKGSRAARHYTAETQLAPELVQALAQHQQNSARQGRGASVSLPEDALSRWMAIDPEIYFKRPYDAGEGTGKSMVLGFGDRASYVETPGLREVQRHRPGSMFKLPPPPEGQEAPPPNPTPLIRELAALKYPQGFIPDFTQRPVLSYQAPHEILGRVTYEEYAGGTLLTASGQMRPVIWTMARAEGNQTWVQAIRFVDSKVNSYGVYGEIIDSGVITSKPIEHSKQTDLLTGSPFVRELPPGHPYAGRYVDITPTLELLKPIRDYRRAKGLPTGMHPWVRQLSDRIFPSHVMVRADSNRLSGLAPVVVSPARYRPLSPGVRQLSDRIFPAHVMARVDGNRPSGPAQAEASAARPTSRPRWWMVIRDEIVNRPR